MFCGTSKTVGELASLRIALDHKAKMYQYEEYSQGAKRAALNRFSPPTKHAALLWIADELATK